MRSFCARVYLVLTISGFWCTRGIRADWHHELFDAIKSEQEAKALRIIEQHKNEIRTAPFANDSFKNTLLHEAAREGFTDVVRALLDAGSDFEAEDSSNAIPVELAVMRGHVNTARLLIEHGRRHGVDFVNRRDRQGYTLLHLAASASSPEMVRYLLDQGADRNVRAREQTPLDIARRNEQEPGFYEVVHPIVEILENYRPLQAQITGREQATSQGRVNLVQDAQRHFQAAQQQQANTGVLARLANWWHGGGSN